MTRRRDGELRPIGETLAAVTRSLGMAEPGTVGDLFGGWSGLVGDAMAAHVRPRALRDHVLTVSVDDAAWATQLRYLEGDLLRRLADLTGPDAVRSLRIVVEAPG